MTRGTAPLASGLARGVYEVEVRLCVGVGTPADEGATPAAAVGEEPSGAPVDMLKEGEVYRDVWEALREEYVQISALICTLMTKTGMGKREGEARASEPSGARHAQLYQNVSRLLPRLSSLARFPTSSDHEHHMHAVLSDILTKTSKPLKTSPRPRA